jgi:hypothetical protein
LPQLGSKTACIEGLVYQRRQNIGLVAVAREAVRLGTHRHQSHSDKRYFTFGFVRLYMSSVRRDADMWYGRIQSYRFAREIDGFRKA